MKAFHSICKTWVLLALIPAMFLTGCVKEKFDVPPIYVPSFTLPAGATLISIKALNARHTTPGALDSINDNVYIRGIVTGNDEFGNIYKALYIQDDSAGIELALNQASLYNDYKQGQVLYVKCQGLILGDYGGLNQLGSAYNGSAGQLAAVYIPQHLFKDGLPGAVPAPVVVNNAADLTTGMLSTLVRFNGASFLEAGLAYVNTGDVNTNRTLNIAGGTLIVRTSKYANFAASILPSGTGTVVGILTIYNGAFQLVIRNTTDVYGFTSNGYTTVLDELFASDPGWAAYSVASNKNWTYSSTYACELANNYGADVAGEDWLFTPEIDLTGMDSATLNFDTWSKYADAGEPNPLQVLVSANYVIGNNPNLYTWTPLTANFCPYTAVSTPSGTIDLTPFVNSKIRIAWKYLASGTTNGSASEWELTNVLVRAKHP